MRLFGCCLLLLVSFGLDAATVGDVKSRVVVPCVDTVLSRLATLEVNDIQFADDEVRRNAYVVLRDRSDIAFADIAFADIAFADIALLAIDMMADRYLIDGEPHYLSLSRCVLNGMDFFLADDVNNPFVRLAAGHWDVFYLLFDR